jgi:glyoxylase-like metal-dependent hydrolase (beta-lactamase superfamily II)/cysteine sulfinate desulfinase/cysteine desulfurase-like protein
VGEDGFIRLEELRNVLKAYNEDRQFGQERIRLIALTGASNVEGTGVLTRGTQHLKEITGIAHHYGAEVLVDAAQAIAHRRIEIEDAGVDHMVYSGHKIFVPFGVGGLISRRASRFYDTIQKERIDVNKKSISGLAAQTVTLALLTRVGMDLIQHEEADLTTYALEQINSKTIKGLKLLGVHDLNSVHAKGGVILISFAARTDGLTNVELGKALANLGFSVRSGCFCNHPRVAQLLQWMGIPDWGAVRISLGHHNTRESIDRLRDTLKWIAEPENKQTLVQRQTIRWDVDGNEENPSDVLSFRLVLEKESDQLLGILAARMPEIHALHVHWAKKGAEHAVPGTQFKNNVLHVWVEEANQFGKDGKLDILHRLAGLISGMYRHNDTFQPEGVAPPTVCMATGTLEKALVDAFQLNENYFPAYPKKQTSYPDRTWNLRETQEKALPMGVSQLYQIQGPDWLTYVIVAEDGTATVVDPALDDVVRIQELIDRHGAHLKFILETHRHAEHRTGARALKWAYQQDHPQIVAGKNSGAVGADIPASGETILQGVGSGLAISAFSTQGHTAGDITYKLQNGTGTGPQLFFTGDFVFKGFLGRTDFGSAGGDATNMVASAEQFFNLPVDGSSLILPAHRTEPGEDAHVTTFGAEKAGFDEDLSDREALLRRIANEGALPPEGIENFVAYNTFLSPFDPYAILEIGGDASLAEIKKAYQDKVSALRSNVNGLEDAKAALAILTYREAFLRQRWFDKIKVYSESNHQVLLKFKDGRVILGHVKRVDSSGRHLLLDHARFPAEDFTRDDEGRVVLSLDSLPEIVKGIGDVVRLDSYLSGLSKTEREHVAGLFYSGDGSYIEDQLRLARESRAAIDRLPESPDKALILDLFQARSEKEALQRLGTSAIADLPTEIIRAARRIQAGLREGEAAQGVVTTLIRLQTEAKRRQDFSSLTSDGFVRTDVQHISGSKILDTLRERWGTTRPDIVIAGAGPTGIVQALLYGLLGYKVLLVDKGFAGATWADKLNLAVHVLRSPAVRNDMGHASLPLIEKLIGFKDHLPLFRLLAQTGRDLVEELTGIKGYADSGLPREVRELTNTSEAKGNVLAHPSTRGELFLQFFALLDIALSRGNVILLEETPLTKAVRVPDGWDVTIRTDDTANPELSLPTGHLHNATGFSGTRGEFSKIPRVFENWAARMSHFLVRDGFEMDQTATLEHLSNKGSTPLIVTAPLVGYPAFVEYYRGLPAGTKVGVVGDGESALKTLKTLSDLNTGVQLVLFAKTDPKETGRYYTAGQNRRLHVEDFLRHPERHGAAQLTEEQRKAGFISPQSMADYQALVASARLTLQVLGEEGFNERTNPDLFKDVHGPWVIAAGYATPEERLPLDPVHAGLLADGRSLKDSLNPVASHDGRLPLHLGDSTGPTYTGPVVRIIALAYITGSFGFAWAMALYNALDYFFEDHPLPVQPLAVLQDGSESLLKPEEVELYDLVRDIFHSPEFHRLNPALELPRCPRDVSLK